MSPEAVYVAMSRGRQANCAHVATQPEVPDEATGATHDRARLTAPQVLADLLAQENDLEQAALVTKAEDVRQARSMYTIHAQYEEAARHICRIRTDQWLDQLIADGTLTEGQRVRLAGDQATDQLSRQLRAVERAGHDPARVLREAIGEYEVDSARSIAQVLRRRIMDRHAAAMKPRLQVLGDVAPADVPAPWRVHLAELAEAAAERRRELGVQVAQGQPAWAVAALGPVPDDVVARAEWEHQAGIVAGYREAAPSDVDEAQVIGAAPGTSTPERRAAWHAAWTALGRPEAGVEEQDLSEGVLRARVKAWEAARAWVPRNVDAEMRATGQSVLRYEQEAAILRAQAEAVVDAAERARLVQESEEKSALAATMREVEAGLAEVAEQRAVWLVETAQTKEIAERAQRALADRGRDIGAEPDRVTAEEWLELHRQAMAEDDARLVE